MVPARMFRLKTALLLVAMATAVTLVFSVTSTLTWSAARDYSALSASVGFRADHRPQNTLTNEDDGTRDELLQFLQTALHSYSGPQLDFKRMPECTENTTGAKVCYNASCPGTFSSSVKERLHDVLSVTRPIPLPYWQALTSAARNVTPHKYIFVTGASSNHYGELQALLHSVFNDLFPRFKKEDFTFLVYNLGLSPKQRQLTAQKCRCTLIDFPFAELPEFVKGLSCFAWKPLLVASLLGKAEYLVWMDSSIRWNKSAPLEAIFSRTRAAGYQGNHNGGSIAVRTQATMTKVFSEQLCQYSPFDEMEGGFGFYYNNRFMREVVVQAWTSCALRRDCMCLPRHGRYIGCPSNVPHDKRYGSCHRFDQSALGVILSKLFLERRPMLHLPRNTAHVKRGHGMDWFESH